MSGSVWILLRLLSVEIFHIDKPDPSSPPPPATLLNHLGKWQILLHNGECWRGFRRLELTQRLVLRYLVTRSYLLSTPALPNLPTWTRYLP